MEAILASMEANRLRDIAITAIAPITWGSTYFVTKTWLPSDLPLTGAAIRALPAGLLLLLLTRKLPKGSWWWRTALISFLTVGGFFVLIYVVGQRLPSGVAATLMASSSVVVLILARVLLAERASLTQYLGAIAGVVGVSLLVGGAQGGLDPIGVAASLGAMLMSSIGFVLTKRWQPPVTAVAFSAWQLTFGGLMVLPVAIAVEGRMPSLDPTTLAGFAYLTLIATALAYVAWFHGLRVLPAGTVGLIGLLNPLAGALLGLGVAGESMSMTQAIGAAAIVLGVLAGIRPAAKPRADDATASQASIKPCGQPT